MGTSRRLAVSELKFDNVYFFRVWCKRGIKKSTVRHAGGWGVPGALLEFQFCLDPGFYNFLLDMDRSFGDSMSHRPHLWLSRLKLELFEAKTCCVVLAESCGNRLKI